jgi:hypothetical protein
MFDSSTKTTITVCVNHSGTMMALYKNLPVKFFIVGALANVFGQIAAAHDALVKKMEGGHCLI